MNAGFFLRLVLSALLLIAASCSAPRPAAPDVKARLREPVSLVVIARSDKMAFPVPIRITPEMQPSKALKALRIAAVVINPLSAPYVPSANAPVLPKAAPGPVPHPNWSDEFSRVLRSRWAGQGGALASITVYRNYDCVPPSGPNPLDRAQRVQFPARTILAVQVDGGTGTVRENNRMDGDLLQGPALTVGWRVYDRDRGSVLASGWIDEHTRQHFFDADYYTFKHQPLPRAAWTREQNEIIRRAVARMVADLR